jgi:hypothetical protein
VLELHLCSGSSNAAKQFEGPKKPPAKIEASLWDGLSYWLGVVCPGVLEADIRYTCRRLASFLPLSRKIDGLLLLFLDLIGSRLLKILLRVNGAG